MHKNLHLHALIMDNLILNPICITISSKVWLLCATLNEHARYKRGVGRHDNGDANSHGKWWSCVVSRFPLQSVLSNSPPVGKGSQGGLLGRMDNKRKCI